MLPNNIHCFCWVVKMLLKQKNSMNLSLDGAYLFEIIFRLLFNFSFMYVCWFSFWFDSILIPFLNSMFVLLSNKRLGDLELLSTHTVNHSLETEAGRCALAQAFVDCCRKLTLFRWTKIKMKMNNSSTQGSIFVYILISERWLQVFFFFWMFFFLLIFFFFFWIFLFLFINFNNCS